MITSISQGFDQKIRIFDWCLGLCSKSFRENTRKTPKGEDILPLSLSRILDRVKVGILSYVKLAVLRNLKLRKIFENLKLKNFIVSSQNIFSTIYVWISTFNASNPGQYITKTTKLNLVLTGLQQLDSIFCTYFSSPKEQMYIK